MRRTSSRLMMVTALMYPAWLSPALSRALARWRWKAPISRSGSPLRSIGMKNQLTRSAWQTGTWPWHAVPRSAKPGNGSPPRSSRKRNWCGSTRKSAERRRQRRRPGAEIEISWAPLRVILSGQRGKAGANLLERQIFWRLAENTGIGQIPVGIHRSAAKVHFVVQVRGGGASGAADQSDDLGAAHFLPGVNQNLGQVRVIGLQAAAVVDNHQSPIAAGHHLGLHHDAIRGGADDAAGGRGEIDALMERTFSGERIGAAAEGTYQPAFDRPETGRRFERAEAARAAVRESQFVGIDEVIEFLQTFGDGGDHLAFGGNVRRPLQFLLDAVGHGDFPGVELQAGHLHVGLADHFLQILVTRPHAVGFLFEGVVVGHFPGHAGVAGDETECGKTTEDSQSENRINRGM